MATEDEAFEANLRREEEFMQRLGRAFAEWQSVEGACYHLYAHLMKGANRQLISVTFFHIQSFSSRLLLIDRCFFFAFKEEQQEFKDRWKALKKRVEKLRDLRNLIAHSAYMIEGKGLNQTPVLKPSHFDATAIIRKRAMNPDYRIDEEKLALAAYDFDALARDIIQFRKDFVAASK